MKIAVDVDDTLMQSIKRVISLFNKKHNTNYDFEDSPSHMFQDLSSKEYDKEYVDKFIEENFVPDYQADIFDKFTISTIKNLAVNNELIILTSRGKDAIESTRTWLEKQGIINYFSNLYFLNDSSVKHISCKSHKCLELGVDYLIEDSVSHSLNSAKKGINVILIDRPWNKNINHKNIQRVQSWEEIDNIFKNN